MFMRRFMYFVLVVVFSLLLGAGSVFAFEQYRPKKSPLQSPEHVYGSQLMTEQERADYFNRMSNAASDQEREKIRREHHERMKKRAEKMGVTLPDEPPETGMGRGKQMGPGKGKGSPRESKGPDLENTFPGLRIGNNPNR